VSRLLGQISELERKLNLSRLKGEMIQQSAQLQKRKRFFSEDSTTCQPVAVNAIPAPSTNQAFGGKVEDGNVSKEKEERMAAAVLQLRDEEELIRSKEDAKLIKRKAERLELLLSESKKSADYLQGELDKVQGQAKALYEEKRSSASQLDKLKLSLAEKQTELEMWRRNAEQLKQMMQVSSNEKESEKAERLHHLSSIQELQRTQTHLVRERDEARLAAAEKEREMTGLRREVNSVIDKKKRLEQELERLKQHLVTVEETYTQEALVSEERERGLRTKLSVLEEQLRTASAQQTTTSRAASQRREVLEARLSEVTRECEQAKMMLFSLESEYAGHQRAVDNLNMALEGFQLEKTNDLKRAEAECQQRLEKERRKQDDLLQEVNGLKDQLEKANEGLKAANRLGDQLEQKTKAIAALRQDVNIRDELLKKAQQELDSQHSISVAKVDRYLVKNLIVGYLVADPSKKPEVVKILATVLDFNQEERDKTGLSSGAAGGGGGWLGGWFGGGGGGGSGSTPPSRKTHSRTSSDVQAATGLDQSLAQAFVQFLETESKPKRVPQLPIGELVSPLSSPPIGATPPPSPGHRTRAGSMASQLAAAADGSRRSSNNSTPVSEMGAAAAGVVHNNPIINQSGDLPTFAINRSSSAILKNVLHNNDPSAAASCLGPRTSSPLELHHHHQHQPSAPSAPAPPPLQQQQLTPPPLIKQNKEP